jgi:SOS response regulatory protein OraA/RecX
MSASGPSGGGASAARRRPTVAERRRQRAEVEDPSIVLDAALRFLEPRSRSVAEVRRRLTQAGYRDELVEGAIVRLVDLGMLDDEAFARYWVESRDRAHPRGAIALRRELRQKGVPHDIVRAVLDAREADAPVPGGAARPEDDAPSSADERAATQLLARKAGLLARVADPRRRRQRAYALLARSGFDPEVCARLAATAAAGPTADE